MTSGSSTLAMARHNTSLRFKEYPTPVYKPLPEVSWYFVLHSTNYHLIFVLETLEGSGKRLVGKMEYREPYFPLTTYH